MIRLYDIPDNTFESDEDSSEEESQDEGDGNLTFRVVFICKFCTFVLRILFVLFGR